jgi:hypothetical protein
MWPTALIEFRRMGLDPPRHAAGIHLKARSASISANHRTATGSHRPSSDVLLNLLVGVIAIDLQSQPARPKCASSRRCLHRNYMVHVAIAHPF